jgi:hypothetical protein
MPNTLHVLILSLTRYFPLLALVLVTSCGLKYVPVESPQSFEQRRHDAVEKYVTSQLASENSPYTSIAFGESQVIKPISYKLLDSLYLIKYNLENQGRFDKELEQKIENYRIIALNDTNQVLYIENHIFTLGKGDTLEFYSALFQMEKDLEIDDVILQESVFLPAKYKKAYLSYLFEEAFILPDYAPTEEELNFYSYFKNALSSLSKAEKDPFILHTLKLMQLAARIKSTTTSALLKAQTTDLFHGKSYAILNQQFSPILENKEVNSLNEQTITGYTFTYSFTRNGTNSLSESANYAMEYDAYLRLKKAVKL